MDQYSDLYAVMGYCFNNKTLCEQALMHRSLGKQSNERLEFLGDSILGFVIADELYQRYPDMAEGELSRLRANLVNGEVLADIAQELALHQHIKLGQGEEHSGGRQRRSILADAVEALIAAVYLDAGLDAARECVLRWFKQYLVGVKTMQAVKDPKSSLQEWTQARKLPLPCYAIVDVTGKAHEQHFEVSCQVEGLPHKTIGLSNGRRRAEQEAAEKFLEILRESE